jgi:hypothetical protein
MGLKIELLDVWHKLTSYDKKLGIVRNGENNNYPFLIERLINNSVTAKTAVNIMSSYIYGEGFNDNNKVIVNSSKNIKLGEFSRKIAKNIAKQRGVFIHIDYNANFEFSSFDIIPYSHCRIGKKDDNKYNGKIGVSNKFHKQKISNSDIEFIDVFNPNKKVIESQVKKAGGWSKYKGQIWYYNLDNDYDYSLSTIDAVINDCDSEAQASIFKNKSLRKGFFGKTVVITKPLSGNLEDYGDNEEGRILYAQALSEEKKFKKTIEDFIGAENAGGAMHVQLQNEGDSLDNSIKFENIDSNIDDKIFEYTENSVFKNILMAFNNLPVGLVRSDNSLFAQSGESIKAMRNVYQENTTLERQILQEIINVLMSNFTTKLDNLEITPLIKDTTNANLSN